MNMHSSITPAKADTALSGWLGWLGFRKPGASEMAQEDAAEQRGEAPGMLDLAQQARHELMSNISGFLLGNGLEISRRNLHTALAAFDGSDPALARLIAAQAGAGRRISQDWLNDVTGSEGGQESADIELLMNRLEGSLEAFSIATVDARKASASYGRDLEDHMSELEHVKGTGEIVANLANLAKAMLERTRKVESDMRRSENEARSLRKNLDKARRDAEIDHLTGLPNRRAFETLLAREYRDAKAAIEPLCVAFCDIDNFKQVNDTHGHDLGDRVLRAVAEVFSGISDDRCHAARHGGEEFVILFRGQTVAQARECLDLAREALSCRRFVNRKTDEAIGRITFSGGVADVFAYSDPSAALAAADLALYRAKETGRNQILAA